jgi:hypothetical protein
MRMCRQRSKRLGLAAFLLLTACRRDPIADGDAGIEDENEDDNDNGDLPAACEGDAVYGDICFAHVSAALPTGGLIVTDLDGDGRAEMLAYSVADGALNLLEVVDEEIVLTSTATIAFDTSVSGSRITAADLDGDGIQEILVSRAGMASLHRIEAGQLTDAIWSGESMGAYESAQSFGPSAIVASSSGPPFHQNVSSFHYEQGALHESPAIGTAGCWLTGIAKTGDFDGNGTLDAAFTFDTGDCEAYPDTGQGLLVLLADHDASVAASGTYSAPLLGRLVTGQLDGSAGTELIAVTSSELVIFDEFPLTPNTEPKVYPLSEGVEIGILADLDGDGVDEFVIGVDDSLRVAKNASTLLDARLFAGAIDFAPSSLRRGDLNGDGVDDLVALTLDGLVAFISRRD